MTPPMEFVSAVCERAVTTARMCCRKHTLCACRSTGGSRGCARAHTNHEVGPLRNPMLTKSRNALRPRKQRCLSILPGLKGI
jgi:hypothetical protein